jgi:hypothetical protein
MSGVRVLSGGCRRVLVVAATVWAVMALSGCGTGGESADVNVVVDCGTQCEQDFLSAADVEKILAQTVVAAQARGQRATVAVTDRVGNVLGVYVMTGAAGTFRIDGGRGVVGGLEGLDVLPSTFGAISKAITGAYLSSAGNAFTTRTASQIVQENFNPMESNQPVPCSACSFRSCRVRTSFAASAMQTWAPSVRRWACRLTPVACRFTAAAVWSAALA